MRCGANRPWFLFKVPLLISKMSLSRIVLRKKCNIVKYEQLKRHILILTHIAFRISYIEFLIQKLMGCKHFLVGFGMLDRRVLRPRDKQTKLQTNRLTTPTDWLIIELILIQESLFFVTSILGPGSWRFTVSICRYIPLVETQWGR